MPDSSHKMVRIDRTRPERHRESIKAGMIIRKLQDHIQDAEATPMTATQVQAARLLLGKVAPDLKAVEVSQGEQARSAHSLTASQLMSVIDGDFKRVENQALAAPERAVGGSVDGGVSDIGGQPPPAQKKFGIEDESWKEDESITGTFRGMPVRSREWLLARMPKEPPEGYEYGGVSLRGDSIELVKIDPDAPDPISGKKGDESV